MRGSGIYIYTTLLPPLLLKTTTNTFCCCLSLLHASEFIKSKEEKAFSGVLSLSLIKNHHILQILTHLRALCNKRHNAQIAYQERSDKRGWDAAVRYSEWPKAAGSEEEIHIWSLRRRTRLADQYLPETTQTHQKEKISQCIKDLCRCEDKTCLFSRRKH